MNRFFFLAIALVASSNAYAQNILKCAGINAEVEEYVTMSNDWYVEALSAIDKAKIPLPTRPPGSAMVELDQRDLQRAQQNAHMKVRQLQTMATSMATWIGDARSNRCAQPSYLDSAETDVANKILTARRLSSTIPTGYQF